jgi:hypothetical protein
VNDIAELRRFVVVHAKAQKIRPTHYQEVLARIQHDGTGPGSWVYEWTHAGEQHERAGRFLDACRDHNIARFPFVDGPARQDAHERCIAAFDRWRRDRSITPLVVDLPDNTRVRCWTSGLSRVDRRPLQILMGGIVAIKEQWAPALPRIRALGLAGIAVEMPGVGENQSRYSHDGHLMLAAVMDAVGSLADVSNTRAIALSFSGHLALRQAAVDRRLRGIITSGVPVREFFTDETWFRSLPRLTTATLAHLTGVRGEALLDHLRPWALGDGELAALDIPVRLMVSARDEIIPAGDVEVMRAHIQDLETVEYDDVHGSPSHVAESRMWTTLCLTRMAQAPAARRAVVRSMLAVARARRAITAGAR